MLEGRRESPASKTGCLLLRLGSLSEKDGDIDSALRWYRRAAATGDAPSAVYPDAADEVTADTTAADAVAALVRLESQRSPEQAAEWCLRVINSSYTSSQEPTVLAAIELARTDAASADTEGAIAWYDYALGVERDSAGSHHRFLYWSAVVPSEDGPGVPRTPPGILKSLARSAWALFRKRPPADGTLLESGLLQAGRETTQTRERGSSSPPTSAIRVCRMNWLRRDGLSLRSVTIHPETRPCSATVIATKTAPHRLLCRPDVA